MNNGDRSPGSGNLAYTWHALNAMAERMILKEWVERTVTAPAVRVDDPNDSQIERFFLPIPEYDDRVLRVAVNTRVAPWRVVSVFFDRRMRGRI